MIAPPWTLILRLAVGHALQGLLQCRAFAAQLLNTFLAQVGIGLHLLNRLVGSFKLGAVVSFALLKRLQSRCHVAVLLLQGVNRRGGFSSRICLPGQRLPKH